MIYQIDDRLAEFSKNLWKPLVSRGDMDLTPTRISQDGKLIIDAILVEGPETDRERFESINWYSARPSRAFRPEDFISLVHTSKTGALIGNVGFTYQLETAAEVRAAGVV